MSRAWFRTGAWACFLTRPRTPAWWRLNELGLAVLLLQAKSRLADKEDHLVIAAVAERVLGGVEPDSLGDFTAVQYDEHPAREGDEA